LEQDTASQAQRPGEGKRKLTQAQLALERTAKGVDPSAKVVEQTTGSAEVCERGLGPR
jgi:hypothetical protein